MTDAVELSTSDLGRATLVDREPPARRFYAMDWLRTGAFLLLIWVHSATMFTPEGWHLRFQQLPALETFLAVCKPWRMELIFLVSGTALSYSLDRRGAPGFARQVTLRLLPPLVLGVVLLIPPTFYFEAITAGHPITLWDAYVLQAQRMAAGDLTWYILWYLGYLLAFCLGLAVIWRWAGPIVHAARMIAIRRDGLALFAMLALGLPIIVVEAWLSPIFPIRRNFFSDIASVCSFGILFTYGMTIMRNQRVLATLGRHVVLMFVLAICATIAALGTAQMPHPVPDALRGAQIWLTVCCLCGFAIRFLDRPNGFITRFNRIVFPFYLIHQLAILTVAWLLSAFLQGWPLYVGTAIAASVICVTVIRVAIVPFPLLHPWFGIMKR